MKTINEMKLSFPSKSRNEAFARAAVAAFIAALDPTVSELSDLKTAVSEAETNCIVHGYRRTRGTVYPRQGRGHRGRETGDGTALHDRSRGGTRGTGIRGHAEFLRQGARQLQARVRHDRHAGKANRT